MVKSDRHYVQPCDIRMAASVLQRW